MGFRFPRLNLGSITTPYGGGKLSQRAPAQMNPMSASDPNFRMNMSKYQAPQLPDMQPQQAQPFAGLGSALGGGQTGQAGPAMIGGALGGMKEANPMGQAINQRRLRVFSKGM